MHHGEEELEELRATERSPSNTWPWRGAGCGPCIWRSLLLVHTQQSVNCHALQRISLSALYTYVTINTLIIFSTFSNGRRVVRGLPSYIRAGIMAGWELATSDVGGERRQRAARKTPASVGGDALRGRWLVEHCSSGARHCADVLPTAAGWDY